MGNHGKWLPAHEDKGQTNPFLNPADRQRRKGAAPTSGYFIDDNGFAVGRTETFQDNVKASVKSGMEKLSEPRQEYMKNVLARNGRTQESPLSAVSIGGSKSLVKTASSGTIPSHTGGHGSVDAITPDLYSPLYLTANLMLPRDRIQANAWNRAFYEMNPIVRNAINLHSTYPISKLSVKCEDKRVEKFFEDMAQKIDLISVVQNTALEYWKLGEVFNFAELDPDSGTWRRIYQLNPDFVVVKQSPIPGVSSISLRPDPQLQNIVHGTDAASINIRNELPPNIIEHVLKGELIPMDSFNVSHLKTSSSPYDNRGTSIIVSVWKDLVMLDKYRECKLVQADTMVNPLMLIKIGADGPDGIYPQQEEIDAWRSVFEQAEYDKNFKIFTHPDVNISTVGYSGQTLDVNQDVQLAMDNVLTGLMVPKAILNQEGATFASASVGLDVMKQRYNNFRTMMANWLEQKIFAPISEIQGFYKTENGVKTLIVPKVEWNQMTLYDVDTYITHLLSLLDKKAGDGVGSVSRKTLFKSLGLDFSDEMANIKREFIEVTILQKEMDEIKKMELSKLRSLDTDKPIMETSNANLGAMLPGVSLPGQLGAPAGSDPGGMPGGPLGAGPSMDMGSGPTPGSDMPPMPPMPDLPMT